MARARVHALDNSPFPVYPVKKENRPSGQGAAESLFPTGGEAGPHPASPRASMVDPVQFRGRRYSPDERRPGERPPVSTGHDRLTGPEGDWGVDVWTG